ncbi:MAG TPA: hypothetical protein VFS47_11695 [Steroidobacteraceae bacterium]|nr:hypothetical protein [Steroidobacteraceae bacterium]
MRQVRVERWITLCRIDPAIHEDLIKRPGCSTVVMKRRAYRGYVFVDAEVLATKRDLKKWIAMALEFNRQLKAK